MIIQWRLLAILKTSSRAQRSNELIPKRAEAQGLSLQMYVPKTDLKMNFLDKENRHF